MSKPIVSEFNCTTGVLTTREMTDEEYAAHQIIAKENEESRKAQEAADAERAAAATSAAAKLAALGLTPDEIAALRG
jgi:hypothetical protein